jgi:hypothetical protein
MKKNQSGSILLIMLLAVAIIALIVFAREGAFSNLMGTKENPGTVKVQLDDLQKNVGSQNEATKNALEE